MAILEPTMQPQPPPEEEGGMGIGKAAALGAGAVGAGLLALSPVIHRPLRGMIAKGANALAEPFRDFRGTAGDITRAATAAAAPVVGAVRGARGALTDAKLARASSDAPLVDPFAVTPEAMKVNALDTAAMAKGAVEGAGAGIKAVKERPNMSGRLILGPEPGAKPGVTEKNANINENLPWGTPGVRAPNKPKVDSLAAALKSNKELAPAVRETIEANLDGAKASKPRRDGILGALQRLKTVDDRARLTNGLGPKAMASIDKGFDGLPPEERALGIAYLRQLGVDGRESISEKVLTNAKEAVASALKGASN